MMKVDNFDFLLHLVVSNYIRSYTGLKITLLLYLDQQRKIKAYS